MKKYISPTIALMQIMEDVITSSVDNILEDDFTDNTTRNWIVTEE